MKAGRAESYNVRVAILGKAINDEYELTRPPQSDLTLTGTEASRIVVIQT